MEAATIYWKKKKKKKEKTHLAETVQRLDFVVVLLGIVAVGRADMLLQKRLGIISAQQKAASERHQRQQIISR